MPDNGDGDKSSYLESEWVFKTINWCFYSLPLHLNVQISQRTWMHSKLHRGGRAPLLSTVWVSQRFAGWKWGLQKCPNCTEISEVLRRAYYNAGSNQKLWSLWIERRCFWSVASVDNELVLLWSLCVCVLVYPCGEVYFYTSFSRLLISPHTSSVLLPINVTLTLLKWTGWIVYHSKHKQAVLVHIALKGHFLCTHPFRLNLLMSASFPVFLKSHIGKQLISEVADWRQTTYLPPNVNPVYWMLALNCWQVPWNISVFLFLPVTLLVFSLPLRLW